MEQNVDFFRLVTGEDIVSEYEEADGIYILINPCKVVYLTSEKPGYLSISLMQWVFAKLCGEQVFDLPKAQVLLKSTVNETMVDHYYRSVEYFNSKDLSSRIEFDNPIAEEQSDEEIISDESMNLLEEIMKKIQNGKKGTLH